MGTPSKSSEIPKGAGHRERLRDKFLKSGLDKLTDEEIVELLLTLGTPRKDCKQISRELLRRFKNFRGVLEGSLEELQTVPGVGPKNSFGIKLIHQIARRFLRDRTLGRDFLSSTREVLDYCLHGMRDLKHEALRIFYLNSENAILTDEILGMGAGGEVLFTPRQVVESAFRQGASSVVLVHNHPSGNCEPSEMDLQFTRELVFTLGLVDIRVRDHLIIGDNRHFSFFEEGWIDRFTLDFERFREGLVSRKE